MAMVEARAILCQLMALLLLGMATAASAYLFKAAHQYNIVGLIGHVVLLANILNRTPPAPSASF